MADSMIPYSFIPGTKAKAGEVNANFIALADAIENNRQAATGDIEELNETLETKADKTRVDEIDEVVSKAFDTMNKSCGFNEEVAYTPQNELIKDCVSLSEAMEIVAEKANSPQIDTSSFATKEELAKKQDILISGTNIKTVNGESLLGSGNIVIQSGTGGITDAPSNGKKYVRQNANWVEETKIDTDTFATKNELALKADKTAIADMATQTWVTSQGYLTSHQDISNLATKQEVKDGLATKQDTLVSGKNIKTVNGESLLGSGDISLIKSQIMTQQEYDELSPKDNNTVYFIVG